MQPGEVVKSRLRGAPLPPVLAVHHRRSAPPSAFTCYWTPCRSARIDLRVVDTSTVNPEGAIKLLAAILADIPPQPS